MGSKTVSPVRATAHGSAVCCLLLGLAGPAAGAALSDEETRNCVARAESLSAIAACERMAQSRWREQVAFYHRALRHALPDAARARYEAAQQAWERFREAEFLLIDSTLGGRDPAVGATLVEGAKAEFLRQRAAALASHLDAVQRRAEP